MNFEDFNRDTSGKRPKQRDIGDFWSYIDGVDYSADYGDDRGGFGSDNFFDDTGMENASSITDQNDLFGFNNEDQGTYDFFTPQSVTPQERLNSLIQNAQLRERLNDVNHGNAPMNPREGRIQPFDSQNPETFVNPNANPKRLRSPEGLF